MGAGLVLLAAAQETLPLHQDDAVATDLLGKIGFGQEGAEVRNGLGVLLLRVEAEGQALPGLVRLGVLGMLLEELLEPANGGWVELPVVGTGGEVVEIEGWILLLGLQLPGKHHQYCEEDCSSCCEPAVSSSHHLPEPDDLIRGCHSHFMR